MVFGLRSLELPATQAAEAGDEAAHPSAEEDHDVQRHLAVADMLAAQLSPRKLACRGAALMAYPAA